MVYNYNKELINPLGSRFFVAKLHKLIYCPVSSESLVGDVVPQKN
jgi:hypothetical protein